METLAKAKGEKQLVGLSLCGLHSGKDDYSDPPAAAMMIISLKRMEALTFESYSCFFLFFFFLHHYRIKKKKPKQPTKKPQQPACPHNESWGQMFSHLKNMYKKAHVYTEKAVAG